MSKTLETKFISYSVGTGYFAQGISEMEKGVEYLFQPYIVKKCIIKYNL